jgi:2-dehydro-3-deoxyglucarate aldolase
MMSFKQKLKQEVVIGSWITLGHPAIAEIFCQAGFDWLAVDLEHSVLTLREAEELIRVIDLHKKVPLVRLTSNDPMQIKRVMDAGAHGIIVPQINTVEQVKAAYQAMHYPPEGNRGVGLARGQGYGSSFGNYQSWLRENSVLISQIEHIEAVENIESIFKFSGLDGYILGPYDLSASMGKPGKFEDKDVQDAIAHVNEMGKKHNIPGGIHVVEPDIEGFKKRIDEGFKFLAYSLDIRMLDVTSRSLFREIRGDLSSS